MAASKDNAMNITETTTTPTRPPAERANFFARLWRTIAHFLKEVEVELRKTTWPTRNELTKFTIVVMITVIVVSLYLALNDQVIGYFSRILFRIGQ
jgi:preprotein translocase subunit SecE